MDFVLRKATHPGHIELFWKKFSLNTQPTDTVSGQCAKLNFERKVSYFFSSLLKNINNLNALDSQKLSEKSSWKSDVIKMMDFNMSPKEAEELIHSG